MGSGRGVRSEAEFAFGLGLDLEVDWLDRDLDLGVERDPAARAELGIGPHDNIRGFHFGHGVAWP
jgi:hypothetical protein